jgi:hypothetical protein
MRQPVKKAVNGRTYVFHLLKPSRALSILTRLGKIGLPAFGAVFGKGGLDQVGMDDDLKDAAKKLNLDDAFKMLAERLDDAEVVRIVEELMSTVEIGSEKLNWEKEFEGDILGLLAVTKAALEVNYGDFFGVLFGGQEAKPEGTTPGTAQ